MRHLRLSARTRAAPAAAPPERTTAVSGDSLLSSLGWGLLFLAQGGKLATPALEEQGLAFAEQPRSPTFPPITAAPVNILCMDGGGIRGRNMMAVVEEIEAATGRPLCEQFDLVAGTSIGGCGALFIGKYGANATWMARRAMNRLRLDCFAQRSKGRLLRRGHFCHDGRRQFMLELCGREPLRGSPGGPRCFALSSRLASGRGARRAGLEPFLFRTYARPPGGLQGTSRSELWRAVDATSAAPLMFPRARLRRMHLSDGGLVANDPTAVALREAAALWPHRPVGLVLSLGCGRVEGDPRADAKEAARLTAVAAAARGRGDARTLYVRLDPPLADAVSPIETDEARLARMEEATRAHFCASDEARWLVQRLRRRTDGPTSEQRRGGRKQNRL